jgi:Predicted oxidoreductases of the aldo/keto reductase family
METRKHLDQDISLLGFGMMRLPKIEADKPDIEEQHALDMIDHAYQNGVTYYDTAWPYHSGLSEPFAARALSRYPRESFQLATKLPTWLIESEADVDKYFELQLERCGVEYFDFYLIHALSSDNWFRVGKHNIYEKLLKRKEQGQIRNIGFSFHDDVPMLREIASAHPWDFAQIQLNYLDWEFQDAKTQYSILAGKGIPVVIMEPVRGGSLVSLCPEGLSILKEADVTASPASWAMRFAASLPGVLTVLSGMSHLDHVVDNVNTFRDFKPLSEDELRIVDRAVTAYRQAGAVPCTGCRYCMECPAGVDIPLVFGLYNDYKVSGSVGNLLNNFELMGEAKQAKACIACGACLPKCPQSIDIPAELAKVQQVVEQLIAEKNKKD